MKDGKHPDPNVVHPIAGYDKEIYVKPTITNPNILVGEFTYIADAEFERHVTHFYPWSRGWNMEPPKPSDLPLKGDTVIGNDVWIGQNVVILPGVHIGDGAIVGANCVVGSDVEPYTITIGNPSRELRKRFDDELIDLLLQFKWWDKSIEEINQLIPLLTCSNLEKVKVEISERLHEKVWLKSR